jgi:hypothetical protein
MLLKEDLVLDLIRFLIGGRRLMRFEYFERDEDEDRKILIAREKGSEIKTFTMAGEIIGASKFSRKLI